MHVENLLLTLFTCLFVLQQQELVIHRAESIDSISTDVGDLYGKQIFNSLSVLFHSVYSALQTLCCSPFSL